MDHADVEAKGLIDRYHRGDLPPEEEARFEEHFVGCPECSEQLGLARGFQRGLKTVVTEDARAAAGAGLFAWLARRGRLAQWGFTLALLVAAGLPALWLAAPARGPRGTEEAGAAADWRRRLESERQTAAELERRLAESERRRTEERREMESRLARAERPDEPRATALPHPLVNTPVFLLSALRDEPGEPAATIDLATTGDALALAIDVGDDPRFESYEVTITGGGGERLFRQAGLRPNALEALMITFPASFFAAGDHRLSVSGRRLDGGAVDLGSHLFRVVAQP